MFIYSKQLQHFSRHMSDVRLIFPTTLTTKKTWPHKWILTHLMLVRVLNNFVVGPANILQKKTIKATTENITPWPIQVCIKFSISVSDISVSVYQISMWSATTGHRHNEPLSEILTKQYYPGRNEERQWWEKDSEHIVSKWKQPLQKTASKQLWAKITRAPAEGLGPLDSRMTLPKLHLVYFNIIMNVWITKSINHMCPYYELKHVQ